MRIDIITIFPGMFTSPFSESIIKRAIDQKQVEVNIHDLRQWTTDNHHTVDDKPYGGGAGMVMMVEPIHKAVSALTSNIQNSKSKIILTSAKGKTFNQARAKAYSQLEQMIIICGHYEGVDQRVADHIADEEISIGDYVLTGGELPAMVITDSVVRLLPGVLGNPQSLEEESFSQIENENSESKITTEYPQYTRPENYNGWLVPPTLLSGNHAQIRKWRTENSKLS